MQNLISNSVAVKQFPDNGLSSAEVQALLSFPHFKSIDRDLVIRAGSRIFHTNEKTVEGWRQLSGSDSQNVFANLLAHLNEWVDGLELSRTPNNGFMQMRNVRLLELASGKCDRGGRKTDEHGTELPCLEDFGFSICCAMIRGPQGRAWSYFRICYSDEVPRRNGKKIPFKPPVAIKANAPRQPIPMQPRQDQPLREAQQSTMFDTPSFVNYETGGRR